MALHQEKPDRQPIIAAITYADKLCEPEAAMVFRFMSGLKPGCKKVQLPIAMTMLEHCARH